MKKTQRDFDTGPTIHPAWPYNVHWREETWERYKDELSQIDRECKLIMGDPEATPQTLEYLWLESKKAIKYKPYLGHMTVFVNGDDPNLYTREKARFEKYQEWLRRKSFAQKSNENGIKEELESLEKAMQVDVYKTE